MIMFFLPWWTYVLVFTVAWAGAFGAVWLANIAEPGIRQDDGPFPCGEHLGTDEDGAEDWCWQIAGHEGDCLGMRQEWPDESWAGPKVYEALFREEGFELVDVTTPADQDEVVMEWPVSAWAAGPELTVLRPPDEIYDVTTPADQDDVLLPAPGVWQAVPETGDWFTTLPAEPPKCVVTDCERWSGHDGTHY